MTDELTARVFNAIAPVLKAHDRWLPLSVRRAVADAVVAVADEEKRKLRRELTTDERRERYEAAMNGNYFTADLEPADAAMAVADEEITEALRISDAATNAIIAARDTEITRLRAENAALRARVAELEQQAASPRRLSDNELLELHYRLAADGDDPEASR